MFKPYSPIELKVKAASLAAEARIIRNLEIRLKRRKTAGGKPRPGLRDGRTAAAFFKLQDHRTGVVRTEARATHLARMFLKGRLYKEIEPTVRFFPPIDRAGNIAMKYAEGDQRIIAQKFAEWRASALAHWAISAER